MNDPRRDFELLLVNLGTPDAPTPEAVRRFLREFLSDPRVVDWPRLLWQPVLRGIVLRSRPAKVARLYASIWTPDGSPLRAQTEALARLVDAQLGASAGATAAYRYGMPGLEERLVTAARGARRIVAVPLFPQRTASSSGSVVAAIERAARALDLDTRVTCRALAPDDAGYVAALADRVRTSIAAIDVPPEHLLVSFHGIPARVDRKEGGTYSADCVRTYDALLDTLDWDPARASLCFQSRFGPERWLGPATAERLVELPRSGVRRCAVVAPGFLTDGLETLEELGVQGRKDFLAAGGEALTLVPACGDHPELVASLARSARRPMESGAA